jgi:hypothetical protein
VKKKILCVTQFLVLFTLAVQAQKPAVYSILEFGAVANGQTINTKAINTAIQKCHDDGGGTILIPAGEYMTGTIQLLSGINLHLEPGAVLSGSTDTADYLPLASALFNEGYTHYGLIYAKNAINISITGQGIINGNGTRFMHDITKMNNFFSLDRRATRQGLAYMKEGTISEDGPLAYDYRPGMLFTFDHCENIHLTDINIKDAPEWTMRIGDCDNVAIRGITISNNPLIPNNDGINCTSSSNVRISDCNIFTGDDAIAISGYSKENFVKDQVGNKSGMAVNVTVSNCILSSRSSCIRIGYGERLTKNMVFNNIVMYASNRGIGIFARDNSDIEDIIFSNIIINTRIFSGNWWGKGEPIHISAVKDKSTGNGGKIKNIRFSNITATAETGILIYGIPESTIEDIYFDKISLTINPGKYAESFGGNFDLQPVFPASLSIFKHDIPGVYAQYVNNLSISGFELNWGSGLQPYFTNGIEINHFKNIKINGMHGGPAFPLKGLASIRISDGSGARIENNEGAAQTGITILKQDVR